MKLAESITIFIYMAVSQAHPMSKRKELGKDVSDVALTPPHQAPDQYKSIYVRFSNDVPDTPPWLPPDASELSRSKRNTNQSVHHIKQPVCDSVSRWVAKTTAEDMWGNTVNVAQKIDVSGSRIHQYFFETFCALEHCECRGIDTSQYNSKCSSKTIWAYAKVTDRYGTEGWNMIKLRGSCSCSITAKVESIYQNIWENMR